ncbi:Uridylate kinase [uncultured archaeon]|nr:Uridylate kinase [uncultured archaeon]
MFDFLEHPIEQESRPASQPVQGNVFVVSIGGSLIIDENGPNTEKIMAIAGTISSLHSQGKKFVLVVGGGRTARSYVGAMRDLGANNFMQDLAGINVTRVNAMLVANAIPNAHKVVLDDFSRAQEILDAGKIPVFGGHIPFFTTDSVGALIAESLNGTFVNLTNVDGIYDSNPAVNAEAKRFDEIGYQRLVQLIMQGGSVPGQNVVLDLACCMILQRSRIPAVVLNGNNLQNFSDYLDGGTFIGTSIRDIGSEGGAGQAQLPDSGATSGETDVIIPKKRKVGRKVAVRRQGAYYPPDPSQIDF